MAVTNATKIVLHGSGLGEEFAWGIWLSGFDAASEDSLTTALTSAVGLFDTNESPSAWENLQALLSTDQKYDDVSAYFYPDPAAAAEFIAHVSVNKPGTGTVNGMLQQSAVVDLDTGRNGRSYQGRVYLPHTGVAPADTHQLSQGQTDNIVNAVIVIIGDLVQAFDGHYDSSSIVPVVYSPTKAIVTPVTSLSADSRLDVQRRRAKSQTPLHHSTQAYTGP